jgi:hypothetical protein
MRKDWCCRATSLVRKAELWEREIEAAEASLKKMGFTFRLDAAHSHLANLREKALRITINEGSECVRLRLGGGH